MSQTASPTQPTTSQTRIVFDLRDELDPEEIAQFEENARNAGAASLTEHLLNLAIRKPA